MANRHLSTLQQLAGKTIRSATMNLDAHSERQHIEDIVLDFTDGTTLEIVIDTDAEGRSEPLRTDVILLLRESGTARQG